MDVPTIASGSVLTSVPITSRPNRRPAARRAEGGAEGSVRRTSSMVAATATARSAMSPAPAMAMPPRASQWNGRFPVPGAYHRSRMTAE